MNTRQASIHPPLLQKGEEALAQVAPAAALRELVRVQLVPSCKSETYASKSGAKKAREEIQHKEFWAPKTPPLQNSLCRLFFLYSEGKRGLDIKNLRGQGSFWGGSGRGRFLPKFFMFMLFFGS